MKWASENPAEAEKMLVELFPRKIKAEEARLALDLLPKFKKAAARRMRRWAFIHETDAGGHDPNSRRPMPASR